MVCAVCLGGRIFLASGFPKRIWLCCSLLFFFLSVNEISHSVFHFTFPTCFLLPEPHQMYTTIFLDYIKKRQFQLGFISIIIIHFHLSRLVPSSTHAT